MDSLYAIIVWLFSPVSHGFSFVSAQFVVFFTILYILFTVLPAKRQYRNVLLLVFSLYFYYRISNYGIFLLFIISLSDFILGQYICHTEDGLKKKWLVIVSLLIDIGALGYFKYANFFFSQYQSIMAPSELYVPLAILVPVGISYYIFKSLGYTLDCYRGMIEAPETDFVVYLLYTSYFPTIIAGPISRARELLPQFHAETKLSEEKISLGLFFILSGLIKKIVIADFIAANFLDRVLETPNYFSGFENLIALVASPMQVYADFSGYTDMALGISLLFGIEIKNNFNLPFRAKSVTDFWRRWHITLLDWFNEYLFSPVCLALRSWGKITVPIAIIVTFFVSGVWHGAAWTFIVWGVLHGIMLIIEYLTKDWREEGSRRSLHKGRRFLWAVVTFVFVSSTFVLFKSGSLSNALLVFDKIASGFDTDILFDWFNLYYGVALAIVFGYVLHFTPVTIVSGLRGKFSRQHWIVQALIVVIIFYSVYQVMAAETKPFIYLEF